MRYKLRTLLILLAVGPPMLAEVWVVKTGWRAWQRYTPGCPFAILPSRRLQG
jgi:hypothetical protein